MLQERVTISHRRQGRSDPGSAEAACASVPGSVPGEAVKASPGVVDVKREASEEGLK